MSYKASTESEGEPLDEALQKELNPADRRELGTAIGLHAHGVGIGSFVYLRRIFESLLEEAHVEAQAEATWDEAQYEKAAIELILKERYEERRFEDTVSAVSAKKGEP